MLAMAEDETALWRLPMLESPGWQMSYGERAVLEGVLAQLRPRLAVEIGTADGGSLSRIAEWSTEVHSFDLVEPAPSIAALENVTLHTGDSHALLPQVLDELAEDGREVDFVLVDGDHSPEGVRRDIEDLLAAEAIRHAVILLHDTMNDEVRRGVAAVPYEAYPHVALFELDLVPGYLARGEPYPLQLWGGLGMIVVDRDRRAEGEIRDRRFHELAAVVRPARDVLARVQAEGHSLELASAAELEAELRSRLEAEPGDARRIDGGAGGRGAERGGETVAGSGQRPRGFGELAVDRPAAIAQAETGRSIVTNSLESLAGLRDGVPERFVPAEMHGQLVEAEHLARYLWATRFAAGRRVLDAGCGMGYGSVLLAAAGAESVEGVDASEAVIAVAEEQAGEPRRSPSATSPRCRTARTASI